MTTRKLQTHGAHDTRHLPRRIERVLASEMPPEAVRTAVPTGAKVDVGSWLGRRRVWACLGSDRLALVAAGPKPFLETHPVANFAGSTYNHVTGALLPGPGPVSLSALPLPPDKAYRLLDVLTKEKPPSQTNTDDSAREDEAERTENGG